MDKLNKLKPERALSPELIGLIVELVEKHKLGPTRLFSGEETQKITIDESSKTLEEQPFEKIKKIVGEIIIGKFSVKDLSSLINQRLEITKKDSEKIADELTNILLVTGVIPKKGAVLKEKVSEKEEALKKEEIPKEEKILKEEEIPPPKKEGKEKKSLKEDIYRELIE